MAAAVLPLCTYKNVWEVSRVASVAPDWQGGLQTNKNVWLWQTPLVSVLLLRLTVASTSNATVIRWSLISGLYLCFILCSLSGKLPRPNTLMPTHTERLGWPHHRSLLSSERGVKLMMRLLRQGILHRYCNIQRPTQKYTQPLKQHMWVTHHNILHGNRSRILLVVIHCKRLTWQIWQQTTGKKLHSIIWRRL